MLLGRAGISTLGPFPDPPLPPPPLWRPPHQKTDTFGFKVRRSGGDGGGGNSESIDLLQSARDPDPGITDHRRGKAEVIYAVKDPCASGRRRMRIVLLPEDDDDDGLEPEPEDEDFETQFCSDSQEIFRHPPSCSSTWQQQQQEPPSASAVDVPVDPTRTTTLSLSLGPPRSFSKANEGQLRSRPSDRRFHDLGCCAFVPVCCLRNQKRATLYSPSFSSSSGTRGGDGLFRTRDCSRDTRDQIAGRIRRLRHQRRDADVRRLSAPVIVLFIFIGIALAAVGVAVGFMLINTNLLQSKIWLLYSREITIYRILTLITRMCFFSLMQENRCIACVCVV